MLSWYFISFINQHFKLREFIITQTADLHLLYFFFLRDLESEYSLLVLVEVDVVHLTNWKSDFGCHFSV